MLKPLNGIMCKRRRRGYILQWRHNGRDAVSNHQHHGLFNRLSRRRSKNTSKLRVTGTFSALLALCVGNSPVTGEFPSQRPVTRSFEVFLDLDRNKRLSKQSRRRWFETPSSSLWRHFYARNMFHGEFYGMTQLTGCINPWHAGVELFLFNTIIS